MRLSNKVGGKEGRDNKGQTAHICKLCLNSVKYDPFYQKRKMHVERGHPSEYMIMIMRTENAYS